MASRAVVIVKRVTKIETIEIDSCLEETHTLTNTVTDHPVEEGFNISDHSRPDPDVVNLRCFISNTPLSAKQQSRAVQEGSVKFTTAADKAVPIGAIDGRGDVNFKKLEKLRNEGTLIQVATSLKIYKSSPTSGMTIQSITIPRTRQNYDGLEFTIALKQIRIVKNRQTRDTQPKEKNTAKKKSKGAQTPKATVDQDIDPARSLAKDMSQSNNKTVKGVGDLLLSKSGSGQ